TNYCFAELEPILEYENFKEYVKDLHKKFIHIDIIAWDIAVGLDGKPIVLECNFAGSTEFYQLVTQKSFFGDLTEEVLQYVIDEKKKRKPALMKKHRPKFKIRRKQLNKFKNENEKLKKQIKIQKNKIKNMKKQYQNMVNRKNKKKKKKKKKKKIKKRQKKKNKNKKENEKKKKQIKIQKNKIKNMEKQYQNMVNSKSFKLTKPLRKISQKLK